jgi:hypothetical protein
MIEFLDWYVPTALTVVAIEVIAAVALVCINRHLRRHHSAPIRQRPVSQLSNAGTREIRRLRDGQ